LINPVRAEKFEIVRSLDDHLPSSYACLYCIFYPLANTFSQPLECLSKPHSADTFSVLHEDYLGSDTRSLAPPIDWLREGLHPPARLTRCDCAPLLCCTLATHLHVCGSRINTADGVGSTWPSALLLFVCDGGAPRAGQKSATATVSLGHCLSCFHQGLELVVLV